MGLLTFSLNVTLDGCCDHREGIADDELHDYFTGLMDAAGAMLWGRTTYELMENAWPAVARDEKAPRAMREWAQKLEDKPKYCSLDHARRLSVEEHVSGRRRVARGGEGAQREDAARRAGG